MSFLVGVDLIKGEFSIHVCVGINPELCEHLNIFVGWFVFIVAADPSNTEDEFININGTGAISVEPVEDFFGGVFSVILADSWFHLGQWETLVWLGNLDGGSRGNEGSEFHFCFVFVFDLFINYFEFLPLIKTLIWPNLFQK